MPDVNAYFGTNTVGTGGWMGALLELLKNIPEIEMVVVSASSHFPEAKFTKDNVDYITIKQHSQKFRRGIFPADNNPVYLKICASIVNEYKPDIVHIHGTERFYGLMVSKSLLCCPAVFSIQGIMGACSQWYHWFGIMSLKDIISASAVDTVKGVGLLWELREARQRAAREREYIENGKYFFGRTDWDRAYVSYFNSNAKYFRIGEVLRKPFWEKQWQLNQCKRHRIIFSNTRHPRKGTELIIQAVENLKPLYPDIELILIGSLGVGGYAKKLKRKIDSLGGMVKSLGQMDASQIVLELCNAHIFVSASYIDNSPNSVAEAQLVGMPVISSYTGGVPSMVREGETGLFFTTGDVQLLVHRINTIFENDLLAIDLGKKSVIEAKKRHDPKTIVQAQIAAYSIILSESRNVNHE